MRAAQDNEGLRWLQTVYAQEQQAETLQAYNFSNMLQMYNSSILEFTTLDLLRHPFSRH